MIQSNTKSIWFISKYLRVPFDAIDFTDSMQSPGSNPGRGFCLLRSLSKRGYDCTLFVARHDHKISNSKRVRSDETLIIDGIRVIFIRVLPYHRTTSVVRVLGWLQFEIKLFFLRTQKLPKPDYIVASSLSLLSILNGLIFRWRTGAKLTFEVRDVWPLLLTENGGFSRLNPFYQLLRLVEWLGYKYSDSIVATMPNLGEHVENVLGVPRKVYCIPMGIPDELLNAKNKALPRKLRNSFPSEKFIVTYVGSIGIDNALDSLFEAARALQQNTQIVFRIFGKGDLLEKYQTQCHDLDNVVFEGAILNAEVPSVLQKSSILYLATHPTLILRYGQSLNKLIDYMYSGRPVLASHSGFQSMINEAECGYFIPAGDAEALRQKIILLSGTPEAELTKVGARGRVWLLENRQYSQLADDYINIFNA